MNNYSVLMNKLLNGSQEVDVFTTDHLLVMSMIFSSLADEDERFINSDAFDSLCEIIGFHPSWWRNEYFRNKRNVSSMCKGFLCSDKFDGDNSGDTNISSN